MPMSGLKRSRSDADILSKEGSTFRKSLKKRRRSHNNVPSPLQSTPVKSGRTETFVNYIQGDKKSTPHPNVSSQEKLKNRLLWRHPTFTEGNRRASNDRFQKERRRTTTGFSSIRRNVRHSNDSSGSVLSPNGVVWKSRSYVPQSAKPMSGPVISKRVDAPSNGLKYDTSTVYSRSPVGPHRQRSLSDTTCTCTANEENKLWPTSVSEEKSDHVSIQRRNTCRLASMYLSKNSRFSSIYGMKNSKIKLGTKALLHNNSEFSKIKNTFSSEVPVSKETCISEFMTEESMRNKEETIPEVEPSPGSRSKCGDMSLRDEHTTDTLQSVKHAIHALEKQANNANIPASQHWKTLLLKDNEASIGTKLTLSMLHDNQNIKARTDSRAEADSPNLSRNLSNVDNTPTELCTPESTGSKDDKRVCWSSSKKFPKAQSNEKSRPKTIILSLSDNNDYHCSVVDTSLVGYGSPRRYSTGSISRTERLDVASCCKQVFSQAIPNRGDIDDIDCRPGSQVSFQNRDSSICLENTNFTNTNCSVSGSVHRRSHQSSNKTNGSLRVHNEKKADPNRKQTLSLSGCSKIADDYIYTNSPSFKSKFGSLDKFCSDNVGDCQSVRLDDDKCNGDKYSISSSWTTESPDSKHTTRSRSISGNTDESMDEAKAEKCDPHTPDKMTPHQNTPSASFTTVSSNSAGFTVTSPCCKCKCSCKKTSKDNTKRQSEEMIASCLGNVHCSPVDIPPTICNKCSVVDTKKCDKACRCFLQEVRGMLSQAQQLQQQAVQYLQHQLKEKCVEVQDLRKELEREKQLRHSADMRLQMLLHDRLFTSSTQN